MKLKNTIKLPAKPIAVNISEFIQEGILLTKYVMDDCSNFLNKFVLILSWKSESLTSLVFKGKSDNPLIKFIGPRF